MTLTLRSASTSVATTKGAALSHAEMDANLLHLAQSSNAEFLQSGTGAIPRTVQDKERDIVSVFDWFTAAQIADVRAGTASVNVASALQAAIDYATTIGCVLYFPAGIYLIGTTTIVFKANVTYQGASKDYDLAKGTIIKYTGTSDAIQINNTINQSNAVNISIEDMAVQCTTRTSGKAAIADVGSTFLSIKRVQVSGNDYGIILDQSELVVLDECDFELPTTCVAGLWLVNGAEHTSGANGNLTNRITVSRCQFNGDNGTSVVGVGIADDGGIAHIFENNNFNAMDTSIRLNGVFNVTISGNEFEGFGSTSISFATTKVGGASGGKTSEAIISGNFFLSTDAIPCLTFASSSLDTLSLISNEFDNQNVSGTPSTGVSNVGNVVSFGNQQTGTSSTDPFNNINQTGSYTPTWGSTGTAPSLQNGSIGGSWFRNGNSITVTIALGIGSSTTLGTGEWTFSLPFATVSSDDIVGSAYGLDAGVQFNAGVCLLSASGSTVKCYSPAGPSGWSGTQPTAWSSGSTIRMTITYRLGLSS